MKKLRYFLKTVTDYAISLYLILILAVMPFYNREGYSHIGTDKSVFFDTCSVYMWRVLVPVAGLYLVLQAFHMRKELWERLKSSLIATDLFAGGYGLVLIISYFCSKYRSDALWGASGWYMGFWPQMFLVLTYFFVSKLWRPRKWVLYLGLGASFAVFLLGYLNRFGVDPLGMSMGLSGFISTIGNINWYCGYLVSVFFAGAALLWQWEPEKLWKKILLMLYVLVGFGTLVSQGSDSGLPALAVVIFVMFGLSLKDSGRMLMFWQEMVLLGCACLITYVIREITVSDIVFDFGVGGLLTSGWRPFLVTGMSVLSLAGVVYRRKKGTYTGKVFWILSRAAIVALSAAGVLYVALIAVNTIRPGSIGPLSEHPIFTFSAKWGSSRGATWAAGWRCYTEQDLLHRLVGVGPDAMSAYIYQGGSAELLAQVRENFGQTTLTNAHNEWLTVLVDTGVLGLISFGGMMITGIRRFVGEVGHRRTVCACGMCLLAYTVNNIFSFQQAMSVATIFVIFGMGGAFLGAEQAQQKGLSVETSQELL